MPLRDLVHVQPVYILPRDSFVTGVLIPSLRESNDFRAMVGFFSSAALRDLAPGLAYFLQRPTARFRLIISPFLTEDDQKAVREGVRQPPDVLEEALRAVLGEAKLSERALVQHTLKCLAYLISAGRLEIKVGLVRDGLFHPKVWIFADPESELVAHGSSNMTDRGLTRNVEHITIAKSWADSSQAEIVKVFVDEFNTLWLGEREDVLTMPISDAIKNDLLMGYGEEPTPTPNDFLVAWRRDAEAGLEDVPPPILDPPSKPLFRIPEWLNYESGDFAHQSRAVRAWMDANGIGILEMATGSGKTATALICAHQIYERAAPLLLVIAAPFLPLIEQWDAEAQLFGLTPIVPGRQPGRAAKTEAVSRALRRLESGATDIEVLIATHDLLCDPEFQANLERFNGTSMLVGDEVHNLGREGFIANQPLFFTHRLGLSATPERQYDEVGTAVINNYFGHTVFRFTLAEAIGVCLVPYDYFVHPVELTQDEVDKWIDITNQLRRSGWMTPEDGDMSERVKMLLIRRRAVLETAAAKIDALRTQLESIGQKNLRHTLIYATDKEPEQLRLVNQLLSQLGVLFHQVTSQETAKGRVATNILRSFAEAQLQVLTAKRVLDEGVDIPAVGTAFILASTTVERQWVQRRGRVLRKAPGKDHARIHDFLVVPPISDTSDDADTRRILKQELERVSEFARLARNAGSPGGALDVVQPLYGRFFA